MDTAKTDTTPIILTGPPGCGKSHWITAYARSTKRQLFVCPCRKDRTLRDGRQKLHIWARRTEPAVLWLEGADDLTPEAQAFLRRILETHAPAIQFVLECRDAGKLQEPIRSRCVLRRMTAPAVEGLAASYLEKNELSWRRKQQCEFLATEFPDIWVTVVAHREEERAVKPTADDLLSYVAKAYNPDSLLRPFLQGNPGLMGKYAATLEDAGSTWAFLGAVLNSTA